MEYWPTVNWEAVVTSNRGSTNHRLTLPFALIGSHPACNIRIRGSRVPSVVYFAACGPKTIEVWPLCAIAYPFWGEVTNQEILRVGKAQLQLDHFQPTAETDLGVPQDSISDSATKSRTDSPTCSADAAAQPIADSDLESMPVLRVHYEGGKEVSLSLARRVVILGKGHPSTVRIRGVGLETCDHAIVSTNQRCWIVNLHPKRDDTTEDLIQEIVFEGPPVEVGDIQISFSSRVEVKIDRSIRQAPAPSNYAESVRIPDVEIQDESDSSAEQDPGFANDSINDSESSAADEKDGVQTTPNNELGSGETSRETKATTVRKPERNPDDSEGSSRWLELPEELGDDGAKSRPAGGSPGNQSGGRFSGSGNKGPRRSDNPRRPASTEGDGVESDESQLADRQDMPRDESGVPRGKSPAGVAKKTVESERVTSSVTERLVSIRQSRRWQQHGLKTGIFVGVLVLAFCSLIWIAIYLLWPLIQDLGGF